MKSCPSPPLCFCCLAGLLAFLGVPPATAERLFTCGFEENSLEETMWNSRSTTGMVFSTDRVHSGTYSLRFPGASGALNVRRNLSANKTSGSLFVRWYIDAEDWTTDTNMGIFQAWNSSAAAAVSVYVTTDGRVQLKNEVSGTTRTSTLTLATETMYRFELRYLLSDTVGELELIIYPGDSSTPLESLPPITGEDTLNTNVQRLAFGMMLGRSTFKIHLDDIAINDEAGSFQNSWPGAGKIALMVPGSNQSVTWTKTGANCSGTTNADCVDDLPGTPDDANGYNSTSTVQADRFNITSLPPEVPADAVITLVDAYARLGGSSTAGTNTARVLLWDEGGTPSQGPTYAACDTTSWAFMSTSQHLVYNASGKTKANINGFDVGYEPVSLSQTCRATAVWLNVEWVPAPSGGAKRRVIITP
jgi:hypothetical protein